MEKEATLLESGIENEDLCSFYEDELTELYSSCGSDTYRDRVSLEQPKTRYESKDRCRSGRLLPYQGF